MRGIIISPIRSLPVALPPRVAGDGPTRSLFILRIVQYIVYYTSQVRYTMYCTIRSINRDLVGPSPATLGGRATGTISEI